MDQDKILEKFISSCKLKQQTSIPNIIIYSKQLSDFLSNRGSSFEACSSDDLEEYLRYLIEVRKIKRSSIKRIFNIIGSLYLFMEDKGIVKENPVPRFRRNYLREYKSGTDSETRQVISIEQARQLISIILDLQDRAIAVILFKTGIRIGELVSLDIEDVDLDKGWIHLKDSSKRSNKDIPIDDETIRTIKIWTISRKTRNKKNIDALFISKLGTRLSTNAARNHFEGYAALAGFHNKSSKKLMDRFSPHCCRHVWTTEALDSEMPTHILKEIRGDARKEAWEGYNHITKEKLRKTYLAHAPQLGI